MNETVNKICGKIACLKFLPQPSLEHLLSSYGNTSYVPLQPPHAESSQDNPSYA